MESVRRIRRKKGLSQQELADLAGVGQDSISAIETGKHEPHPRTLRKLAKALEIEVRSFFEEPVPLGEAPLPRTREECAFVVVGRVEEDENGYERLRMVVLWNVPPEEREPYRASLSMNGMADYREEEMSPLAAELIAAGA